jgi:hypothetical protein
MTKTGKTYIALGLNIVFPFLLLGLVTLCNTLGWNWVAEYIKYVIVIFVPLIYIVASIRLFNDKNSRPLQFILWVLLLVLNIWFVTYFGISGF